MLSLPACPPAEKFSWRLKIAGKMLNCCESALDCGLSPKLCGATCGMEAAAAAAAAAADTDPAPTTPTPAPAPAELASVIEEQERGRLERLVTEGSIPKDRKGAGLTGCNGTVPPPPPPMLKAPPMAPTIMPLPPPCSGAPPQPPCMAPEMSES
ncbi:formin-like protein 16 [Drosophila serrata]|uniref:formin-like protein 16 n=1 Tax=Drosophila serrata TaxID=7274 RepID=UPI000A1D2941|nr:formin-like protein 16 [Drosophila serrata]